MRVAADVALTSAGVTVQQEATMYAKQAVPHVLSVFTF
jgi:hypothetical protein